MKKIVLGIYNSIDNIIDYTYIYDAENLYKDNSFIEILLKEYTNIFNIKSLINNGELSLVRKPVYAQEQIKINDNLYAICTNSSKQAKSFCELHNSIKEVDEIYLYDTSSKEWLTISTGIKANPIFIKDGISYFRIKDILREKQVESYISLGDILEYVLQKDKETYKEILELTKGLYITKEQLDNNDLTKIDKKRIGKILALLKR